MIRVEDVHMHFGGIRAVNGATLEIAKGSITGLIGPNGAGKTTLFNCIAGHYAPTSGKIFLDGEEITGLAPHELFHKGLLRTFQIAHEFATLTVRENLMMVPGEQMGERLWNTFFHRKAICRGRGGCARARRRGDRLPHAQPRRGRAGGQPLRRTEEIARTRAHHDGGCQDRLPRRGRRGRQPHPAQDHRRMRSAGSTRSAATPSA